MGQSKGYVDVPLAPSQRRASAAQAQTYQDVPIEQPSAPATAPARGWMDELVDLGRGVWKNTNPIEAVKAGVQAIGDPIGTVQNIGAAQGALAVKAEDAFKKGDYITGSRHLVNYLIPLLGPALDASGDKMAEGKYAEGAGEAIGLAAGIVAPEMLSRAQLSRPLKPLMGTPANPKDAAAVQFAQQRGVPLDAGTATGKTFVKNVQKKVANSYGGTTTAEAMQGAQADNLARVGGELAAATGAPVTNPLAAGESIRAALTKQIQDHHTTASTAYEKLRAREAVTPTRPPLANDMTALDISQRTPLAVDITAAVKELQPLYNQLKRESELGIPMHGSKGKTLAALDGLMNSPNFAPLSVVDGALSDLKAMARGADMPELRTAGQATAAQAVQKLDAQVRAAAAKAGPDVLKALDDGRAATKQKYVVADTLDMLSGEPGQVFRQITQSKDVGIERLRAVQKVAPKEMPKVARAFMEDMMQQATAEGGFAHADRLWSSWQKLGSETKQALFPKKGQITDLDNFFLLAKRIKENPNPSGTAQVMNATNLVTAIPAWALSKMLFTTEGVKYLTTAQRALIRPTKSARLFAAANVTKAAQSAGVPLEAIPAFGQETPTAPERQTQRP